MPGQIEAPNPVTIMGYDPITEQYYPIKVTVTQVDSGNNEVYASLAISGGGGGPITVADGADVTLGTSTDAAGANTGMGQLKKIANNTGLPQQAVEYLWNGGGPANQNYDRLRSVLALSPNTATISSGGGIGSTAPVLANANGIQPGQWVLLLGGTPEWVLTTSSYIAGSTTLALTSAIVNASHTSAAWNAYSVYGPQAALFYWDSIGVQGLALNNGTQGGLAQGDTLMNLKTTDFMRSATEAGIAFFATTTLLATATNANLNVGFALLNNNTAKTARITSIQIQCANAGTASLAKTSAADASLTNAITPVNPNFGSANTSLMTVASSPAATTTSATGSGTVIEEYAYVVSATQELLTNGRVIILPAGQVTGIEILLFVSTAGNKYSVNIEWVEY